MKRTDYELLLKAYEEKFDSLGIAPCPCGSKAVRVGAMSAMSRGVECMKCGLNLPISTSEWLIRPRDFKGNAEAALKANDDAYDAVVKEHWNAMFWPRGGCRMVA